MDLLYEYLITSETYLIDEINNQLKYIREKNEEIEQLEQLAYNKNINRNNFELISKVIQLQEKNGNNNCIICGKEDPSKGIIEWKKILTDKNIIVSLRRHK